MTCTCDEIKQLFARSGIRCTKQRIEVYRSLQSATTHPTVEELFGQMQERLACDCMSLATIYNTLEALCGSGLCRKLPDRGGGARYDVDLSDHLHAIGSDGTVHDVPVDLSYKMIESIPMELLGEVSQRLGRKISGVRIELDCE
jgi:Fur family transcriptional regulator, peroxide stress response regulator